MKNFLLFLVAFFMPMLASADEEGRCGENVTYTYVESTHTLTISGSGSMTNYSFDNFNCDSPWYSYRTDIVKLIIEDGLTSIGNYAFSGCTGLISVIIPNSVTSIGECTFQYCSGLTSVTIPNSMTSIGLGAFYKCTDLTSISIPNSVKYVHEWAFEGCTGITSIVVENGNPIYDSRDNCNAIIETNTNTLIIGCKKTIIPTTSEITIGNSAFLSCDSLTSITIPNNVTKIGEWAFAFCTNLTSISIPSSVMSIEEDAFYECTGLTSITISNGMTSIGNSVFQDCTSLSSVTLPNSLKSIGHNAFDGCTALTSITIPNSVTSIGNCVLRYCSNLTSIVMGNGIKDIKRGAFSFCTGLTDFYCYAENVPSIDSNAFIYTDYANVTLHVPSASISSYKSKALWNGFKNIVALTDSDPKPTGISSVNYISLKDDVHYELSGRKIQKPQQGIYIINGKKYIKK